MLGSPMSHFRRQPLHVIAEAGSNHNGDPLLAKALIEAAATAGADSVKFQFINPEGLYLERYWKDGERVPNPVFEQRRREQLSPTQWSDVFGHAAAHHFPCTASVFDEPGLRLLQSMSPPYVKIASTDLNNLPLIRKVAASGLDTLLSTGMSTLAEIEAAVDAYAATGDLQRLTLLHCVSQYPCALKDARLYMIPVLAAAFGLPVGYSDHTLGSEAAIAAVALGASVIEKHYTLDRNMVGFDHAHAMEPEDLKTFIQAIRDVDSACQRASRKVSEAEEVTRVRARRGVYAARDLEPGRIITEDDLLVVRPRGPLAPADVENLVGKPLATAVREGEPLTFTGEVTSAGENWRDADLYWRGEMRSKGMTK